MEDLHAGDVAATVGSGYEHTWWAWLLDNLRMQKHMMDSGTVEGEVHTLHRQRQEARGRGMAARACIISSYSVLRSPLTLPVAQGMDSPGSMWEKGGNASRRLHFQPQPPCHPTPVQRQSIQPVFGGE